MKECFENLDRVVQAWATGMYPRGRVSGANRVYFEGRVLYSYGSHFPLAVRLNNMFIVNSDSYSVSTSKHQGIVRRHTIGSPTFSVSTREIKNLVDTLDRHDGSTMECLTAICEVRRRDAHGKVEQIFDQAMRRRSLWGLKFDIEHANNPVKIANNLSRHLGLLSPPLKELPVPTELVDKLAKMEERDNA